MNLYTAPSPNGFEVPPKLPNPGRDARAAREFAAHARKQGQR
jgi:hypothetical protein